ncbi:hypothetical protein ACIRP0_32735 [Streptomyces sp. NPDC101733]
MLTDALGVVPGYVHPVLAGLVLAILLAAAGAVTLAVRARRLPG